MKKEEYMRRALEEAYKGINNEEGGPFGVVIVKGNEIIAQAHNTVLKDANPTHHAEINAITIASQKINNFDLTGCELYSTTEPCPMCFSAIHWARIDCLYFGTKIEDVHVLGFNELAIHVKEMKEIGISNVKIYPDFLVKECQELLKYWDGLDSKNIY